jgi:hypothetical protein
MNRKMIGEAVYVRVSDGKYNPIAMKRGNVPTQSCSGNDKKQESGELFDMKS